MYDATAAMNHSLLLRAHSTVDGSMADKAVLLISFGAVPGSQKVTGISVQSHRLCRVGDTVCPHS